MMDLKALGIRPPASLFTERDVPDLSGKVAIVTGGNTGIGKETCRVLLAHDAKVYLAARSPEKAEAAIKDLKASTGKSSIKFLQLDLGSIKATLSAAEGFKSQNLDWICSSIPLVL